MYVLPVAITFVCVATLAVGLRLYTRIHLVCSPGLDDWVLVFALLADLVFFAFLVIENHYGLGEYQSALTAHEMRAQLKALWISIPLYNLTLNLTKLSMVLLYFRLFTSNRYRIILTCVLVFVAISGLWMVLSTLLFCIPVSAFWNLDMPHTCLPEAVVWSLNAALQITSDLIIVILPMPALAKLRIPLRQKIALIVVFALGIFVCVTSIIRLYAVVMLLDSEDISHDNGLAATWSFIESNVAIFCASLPPLRPFFLRIFPRSMPSRTKSSSSQNEKPWRRPVTFGDPFGAPNTSYSASVTCSASREGTDSNSHAHPDTEGIQVISELRWDSDSAHSKEDNTIEERPEQLDSISPHPSFSVRFL